jgi:signal transduction histidine kinase
MTFHVKRKVWIGFCTAILILAALWYYAIQNNGEFTDTSKSVAHTIDVLYHIERCRSGALEANKSLIDFLITGDSSFHRKYYTQVDSIRDHYAKLRDLTRDNVTQQSYIDSLGFWGNKKYEQDVAIMNERGNFSTPLSQIGRSLKNDYLQDNYITITARMAAIEQQLLANRQAESEKKLKKSRITFSLLIISTVIILVIVFNSINKTMRINSNTEAKLNQINKELEAFTYSVSHDLRAPLRSINGYAQILEQDHSDKLNAEGVRVIQVIMRNARRMGKLIDDLLDFSRLGKKELNWAEINMNEVVNDLVKEFKESEANRTIEFRVDTLHNAKGDVDMIRQVWLNLISNAVKYSNKNPRAEIEIGSTANGNIIQYFVRDNGVGFDMKYAEKLFNVFQRLHSVQEFDGTGVGLAIVNRIVSRHNGYVHAESKPGKGATFYFGLLK